MNDGEALLKAILANPDDDAPRLIYADWLDGRGECDRAEFIRVQIELASKYPTEPECTGVSEYDPFGTTCCDVDCPWDRWDRLCRREGELLARPGLGKFVHHNVEAWAPAPLGIPWATKFGWQPPKEPGAENGGYVGYWISGTAVEYGEGYRNAYAFRRGFVESVRCRPEEWFAGCPVLLAHNPVRSVLLTEDVDWYSYNLGGNLRLTTLDHATEYDCKNVKYGDWWGKDWQSYRYRTVPDFVLGTEWPGVKVTRTYPNPAASEARP